jgi:hypothetical protein
MWYAQHGPVSDPGEYAPALDALPADIEGLVAAIQGFVLHLHWAERYGVQLDEARREEASLRSVRRILERALELDDRPLAEARPPEQRVVGTCRDYSLLLAAALREKGVPARARCGFGTYFRPNHYEDHWICEVWNPAARRWVWVDAQLDALQREELGVDFDTLDVLPDHFWTGGRAWIACREGEADPEAFGIFEMRGMGFIKGDLLRDFLALNKVEILPWDGKGFLDKRYEELTEAELEWLDNLAALTLAADVSFHLLRRRFETDVHLDGLRKWG